MLASTGDRGAMDVAIVTNNLFFATHQQVAGGWGRGIDSCFVDFFHKRLLVESPRVPFVGSIYYCRFNAQLWIHSMNAFGPST